MIFKERLKALRATTNLSQVELAKVIGYGQSTVASWEIGRTEPSIDGLNRLADYFKVSVDYLLGRSEQSAMSQNPNLFEVFPYERQVIKAYRVLAPSQQEMVSRMLGIAYDMPISKEA